MVHGGGQVGVALDVTADGFELSVQDDGAGATPGTLERLRTARPGRQDAARSRRGGGLGSGIVNAIAHRVGWRVRWDSDGGMRVTVSGPLSGW